MFIIGLEIRKLLTKYGCQGPNNYRGNYTLLLGQCIMNQFFLGKHQSRDSKKLELEDGRIMENYFNKAKQKVKNRKEMEERLLKVRNLFDSYLLYYPIPQNKSLW